MSTAPKKGSFCNILRKSIGTVFVFYCEAKKFKYFTGFQSCLLLFVFANIPTVPILPGQSQFLAFSRSVPNWIDLSPFLYFSPKNVHIYIIFHQQCKTIHLWWIAFIVIHTLNAIKSITVLSSEMIFRKHSIWTFEYYFERHTFDLIINSGKLVQKNQTKYSCPWKQKVCKRLFETIWVHLVFKCFSATQSWFVALLGMHFQFFVLGSQKIRLECLFLGSYGQKHELTFLHVDTNLGKLMLI